MVNVGIYLDLRNPAEWRQDWARLYGFTLELCEEADRLGVHSIWTTEHHGFDDGYLSQPLTMAAAIAARTKRARIGTGVTIAPLRHPAHLAEEAAIVDLVSGGRLELGIGTGYRLPEYELFDRADALGPGSRRPTRVRARSADCGTPGRSRRRRSRSGRGSGSATRARRARGGPGCWASRC